MSRKRRNDNKKCFFKNESFQYRISEKKSKTSLSKLMYRLPFTLITSASKYSQTFYGCETPKNEIIDSKSLKNTIFIGFDYEKYCDGNKLIKIRKTQVKKPRGVKNEANDFLMKGCSVSLNKLSFGEILKMDISLGTKTYIYDLQNHCKSSHSLKYLSILPKDSSYFSKDINHQKEIEYICLSGSDDEENKKIISHDHPFKLNNHSMLSPLKSHITFVNYNQNLVLETTPITYNFQKNSSNPNILSKCYPDDSTYKNNSADNFYQSRLYDKFIEKEKQRQLENLYQKDGYNNRLSKKIYRSNKNYLISEVDVIDLT